MNEDIIKHIEEQIVDSADEVKVEDHSKTTWMIFEICSKRYAIKAEEIHEIIKDVAVYPLPFLPSYIEGVINRRGDPFTVINPLSIIEESGEGVSDQSLFLILKREDDQLSIHISDIISFHQTETSDIHLIPNNDDEGVFSGTIDYENEEIPVFNTDAFELLLKKDLGS